MTAPEKFPAKAPGLADFLCFAVYSANLAFGRAYKPILDELGLTYTQYIALVALGDGDEQTVGALGEKLFLESNTLTPLLKKLRRAVRRHRPRRRFPRRAAIGDQAPRQSGPRHARRGKGVNERADRRM